MQLFLLILGLAMIIKSADVLIDSSSKIARRYGISSFIIGITVIAFGTSAPELAVGIISGINHTNQLSLGNIIGSSLSNIALIVGISAIIMPLYVRDNVLKREIPMLLGIQIILAVMLFVDGRLSRTEGCILLLGFLGFMIYVFRDAKNSMKIQIDTEGGIDTDGDGNQLPQEAEIKQRNESLAKLSFLSLISLLGLFIGGNLTVDSSTQIAKSLGLSETLIGLTVVALATTIPELITSIMAALKKEPDIVLGNCIGSNIFNILLVLGFSSVISPIVAESRLWIDVAAMLILTIFVLIVSLVKKKLFRGTGIFLLLSYIAYIIYKVISTVMA
ncbi:MAG: sodium:proton exchanger [Firmicutes bacterium HGW-Firmicutes-16]|nr:MAG: sodium:proton exchanger [Firmicutes bacterium HGW-Firmicutes-16]